MSEAHLHKEKMFIMFNRILFFINIPLVLLFFWFRWQPIIKGYDYSGEKTTVVAYAFFMTIIIACHILYERLRPKVLLFNTAHFFLLLSLGFIQLVFHVQPSLIPLTAINYEPFLSPSINEDKKSLEYLPQSPWVKFKSNTMARSTDVGRGKAFQHIWKTDSLGFKNSFDLEPATNLWAIAIGDSFVEGMGVSVDKTFSSVLTKLGYPTYNMGVQGYAPQQMVGTLAIFKAHSKIKPKYIILGYTPGHEGRTKVFQSPQNAVRNKQFSGGIEEINKLENNTLNSQEIRGPRYKYFLVLNTFLDMLKSWETIFLRSDTPQPKTIVDWYDEYFPGFYVYDPNSDIAKWSLQSILDVKKDAEQMQAELVVIFFTTREYLYLEGTEKRRAILDNEVLLKTTLKSFCDENKIRMIDTYPALKKYIDGLKPPLKHEELPYFPYLRDGHLNEIGHKITSETILTALKEPGKQ